MAVQPAPYKTSDKTSFAHVSVKDRWPVIVVSAPILVLAPANVPRQERLMICIGLSRSANMTKMQRYMKARGSWRIFRS